MAAKSKKKKASAKKKKSPIGARIRKIREEAGLTRQEFEKLTGVSANTLMGYENHGKDPSGSNLEKIAKSFPASAEYLLLGR